MALLLAFLLSLSDPTALSETIMKSKVDDRRNYIWVDLELPVSAEVAFDLFTRKGMPVHRWTERPLEAGRSQLKLPLPLLDEDVYVLHLVGGPDPVRQLVILPD
ncbi:MAG: hypothetical protein AAFQ02_02780 [Bacteroidota bacterium]